MNRINRKDIEFLEKFRYYTLKPEEIEDLNRFEKMKKKGYIQDIDKTGKTPIYKITRNGIHIINEYY